MTLHRLFFGLIALATLASAQAQWSVDPAQNLVIAGAPSDQAQPKLAVTPDGGCWVSWFDGIANGFDVRVQRLDAQGTAQLAAGGVLVADRGFSSTQDYGLDVDLSGNALLAYRDDSGSGVQITAARVLTDGTLAWGAGGVQLTNTGSFVASPRITGTEDGGAVVAWTHDSDARLAKLDGNGVPLWASDVVLTPGAGSYSPSDVHAAGTDVVVSFVHQVGAFGSARHLVAQKLDAAGGLLWGGGHVTVFDGGSLQFGNFPGFVPDGDGGAVFAWYNTATFQFQCYGQRILSGGTEAFPHNGVPVSTNNTRVRVSPDVAFDAATQETLLFWIEENAAQSQWGVYGQKLDAAGARQWTDEGVAVVAVGGTNVSQVSVIAGGAGALAFWELSPAFGQDLLHGARLDASGVVDVGPFDVASTSSSKSRLAVVRSVFGSALMAWSDDRNDANDVLGQSVDVDGSLGAAAGPWGDLGHALAGASGDPRLVGSGTLLAGDPIALELSDALGSSTSYLVVGFGALLSPLKGGVLVPQPDILIAGIPTGVGGGWTLASTWPSGVPAALQVDFQCWIVDAIGPSGFSASNGVLGLTP